MVNEVRWTGCGWLEITATRQEQWAGWDIPADKRGTLSTVTYRCCDLYDIHPTLAGIALPTSIGLDRDRTWRLSMHGPQTYVG